MNIEKLQENQIDVVVDLSLRAWAPVFESIKASLSPGLYQEFYPDEWEKSQADAVRGVCEGDECETWVAIVDDTVAGFTSVKLDAESKMGEIYMIAVDPEFQKRGIASTLTKYSVERMQEEGMTIAMVETGGDPGHAPARATYEKAGFEILPIARYFMKF